MILQMFSVFDDKGEAYLTPFFMKAKGEAVRAFIELAKDGTSQFAKHPADFTLFHIGTFDDSTSIVTMLEPTVNLGKALEFISKES